MFTLGVIAIVIAAFFLFLILMVLCDDLEEHGAALCLLGGVIALVLGVVFVCTNAPDAKSSKARAMEYLKDYKRQVDDAEEDVRVNKIIQDIKNLNLKEKS